MKVLIVCERQADACVRHCRSFGARRHIVRPAAQLRLPGPHVQGDADARSYCASVTDLDDSTSAVYVPLQFRCAVVAQELVDGRLPFEWAGWPMVAVENGRVRKLSMSAAFERRGQVRKGMPRSSATSGPLFNTLYAHRDCWRTCSSAFTLWHPDRTVRKNAVALIPESRQQWQSSGVATPPFRSWG